MSVTAQEVEEFEDRLRAHLRQRMTRRRINSTDVARLLHVDRSYLSRWLRRQRGSGSTGSEKGGLSVGIMYRMMREFGIDAETLFYGTPPEQFWRPYVPQDFEPDDPDMASPTIPQPTRPSGAGEPTHQKRSRGE